MLDEGDRFCRYYVVDVEMVGERDDPEFIRCGDCRKEHGE
jgi:hypothetical protein